MISKFPDVKDRNKIKLEVVKDIMTDAAKDDYKPPENADITKKVDTEFGKRVMKAIGDYYKKKWWDSYVQYLNSVFGVWSLL